MFGDVVADERIGRVAFRLQGFDFRPCRGELALRLCQLLLQRGDMVPLPGSVAALVLPHAV